MSHIIIRSNCSEDPDSVTSTSSLLQVTDGHRRAFNTSRKVNVKTLFSSAAAR